MRKKEEILIIAKPHDVHATAVAWGLSERGYPASQWILTDFPSSQTISIQYGNRQPSLFIEGLDIAINIDAVSAVWNRRTPKPVVPKHLYNSDREFVKKECLATIASVISVLKEQCDFWVNPFGTAWINNKVAQLGVARAVGLDIPKTLISNDAKEIRKFFAKFKQEIIYKSFLPMMWQSPISSSVAHTAKLRPEDLEDDRVLASSPGIFQHYIQKDFEVRVTVIGKEVFAIKLSSQENEEVVDWRLPLCLNPFPVEIMKIPAVIHRKISGFMQKANLLFGCFDFIVTPDKKWIFLEINPMGQFLWVEELCPELKLLDAFCTLLAKKVSNPTRKKHLPLQFSDYPHKKIAMQQLGKKKHVLQTKEMFAREREALFSIYTRNRSFFGVTRGSILPSHRP